MKLVTTPHLLPLQPLKESVENEKDLAKITLRLRSQQFIRGGHSVPPLVGKTLMGLFFLGGA